MHHFHHVRGKASVQLLKTSQILSCQLAFLPTNIPLLKVLWQLPRLWGHKSQLFGIAFKDHKRTLPTCPDPPTSHSPLLTGVHLAFQMRISSVSVPLCTRFPLPTRHHSQMSSSSVWLFPTPTNTTLCPLLCHLSLPSSLW